MVITEGRRETTSVEEVAMEPGFEHRGPLALMEENGEGGVSQAAPKKCTVEAAVMGALGTVMENRVPLGVTLAGRGLVMEVLRNMDFGMKEMGSQ